MSDIIKDATLAWVNHEREARGIGPALEELPKGFVNNGWRCPIANALGSGAGLDVFVCASRGVHYYELEDRPYAHTDIPPYVEQFIRAFDQDVFPELLAA